MAGDHRARNRPHLEPFYRSALLALEAAGARRQSFGPEPDARWHAFRGELREADRLGLVLRNAAPPRRPPSRPGSSWRSPA